MPLFDRRAAVEVETLSGEALRVDGLRIAFDVLKTRTSATNTCEVNIWNLSPDSRAKIREKDAFFRVLAGYGEDGLEQIFVGRAQFALSQRDTPDFVTRIEVQDGVRELREFRVSVSFRPGATVQQVLLELVRLLRLPLRQAFSASGSYPRGYTYVGPVKEALDQVCRRAGLEWSVQDGQILITAERIGRGQDTALVISPETGLIGSPERINYIKGELDGDDSGAAKRGENADETPDPEWRVLSLLRPRVLPADIVEIRSETIEGRFLVDSVRHSGDTRGQDWYTELELRGVQ